MARKNNIAINVDWLPGYVKTSGGLFVGHRAMFNNNDLAIYGQTRTNMLVYLIEPTCSSFCLELALPNEDKVLEGKIVKFAHSGTMNYAVLMK